MARYADQPGTHREVHIAASPSRVWETVLDVEAMTAWSPELVRVDWLGDAKSPAPEARYVGHNEHPAIGEWQTLSQFTEVVPERTLTWAVLDVNGRYGDPSDDVADRMATWTFTLTPAGEDEVTTVLRQSVTIGPGRSGLNAFIDRTPEQEEAIVDFRLKELGKGMEATLEGIRRAVEGTTPGH